MPSLPSKSRRKHITPIANLHENDVWQRTFKLLGLEPLTPFPGSLSNNKMSPQAESEDHIITAPDANEAAEVDKAAAGSSMETRKLRFLDLPIEAQSAILEFVSPTDLIALALVSRHFHTLSSSHLYRTFHIVFPDDDDPSYESPIDGLAAGLDTFATSPYNYAQHLRSVVLDTLSGGEKGERAYRHYAMDLSCGKFMNTLFMLTLRKAMCLETFRWDLRVEISREVFKALHNIPTLRHVHLRLQPGHSIYEMPPPLPALADDEDGEGGSSTTVVLAPPPPPPGFSINMYATAKYASKHKPKPKDKEKDKLAAKDKDKGKDKSKDKEKDQPPPKKEPPTISGFKKLTSLAVLDMDTLDYVAEVRSCIRNSSSTLNTLMLSFSESLARQARRPPPVEDTDDSDQEIDEFGNMISQGPPPPPPNVIILEEATGPAKTFRAQREKKAQEGVLGRIFGIEPYSVKKSDGGSGSGSDDDLLVDEGHVKKPKDPGEKFIADLTTVTKRWMHFSAGPGPRTLKQKEALEIIEKAARKYVEANKDMEKAKAADNKSEATSSSDGSSTAKATPESSVASVEDKEKETDSAETKKEEADEKTGGLFDEPEKARHKHVDNDEGPNPDDIDVDKPEIEVDPKDFEEVQPGDVQTVGKPEAEEVSDPTSEVATIEAPKKEEEATAIPEAVEESSPTFEERSKEYKLQLQNCENLKDKLKRYSSVSEKLSAKITELMAQTGKTDKATLESLQAQIAELKTGTSVAHDQISIVGAEVSHLQQLCDEKPETTTDKMAEYVRTTRGLRLNSLSIYLIPIKAAILTKAIDFSVLHSITLLNVGAQAPLWAILQKMNTEKPLPLRKIFTDNVTPQFLNFAAELEEITDLFMLEKSAKIREYSFAPRTTVTMDMIRKTVLKKHIGNLQRLLIKNENDYMWDCGDVAMKIICKRGTKLEELGLSFGVRALHTFNQFLPHMTSLRAMHILIFRAEDTCHWVIQELKKFAVDSVSTNPDMKLEYIALGTAVERLVRRAKKPKANKPVETQDKGKGKEGDDKGKGKGKAKQLALDNDDSITFVYPNISSMNGPPGMEWDSGTESDSSDEGEDDDSSSDEKDGVLKLETLEGVRFYDIIGVQIFGKDILAGRL